ncbi:MAG: tetratricopeptide repeat protein [Deltaproteobacteria bacterium]|nr:tetratricopeptide repeat protein [Deltaproteobacteria bacterium]
MQIGFRIIILVLAILGLQFFLYAQEEGEILNEEEIWEVKKKSDREKVKKVEEEEVIPGSFEYVDEDKPKEVKKEEKKLGKEAKVVEPTDPQKKASDNVGVMETQKGDITQNKTQLEGLTQLSIPEGRLPEIDRIWFERLEHLKKREFSVADEKLKKIVEAKLDSGIPDIPPISLALIIESKNAIRANDFVSAQRLAEAAMTISPDLYEVWFFCAYLNWRVNKTDIIKTINFIWGGLKRVFLPIVVGPLVVGNILTITSLIISLTSLLFIVVLLIKNSSRILHDLSHLFPSGRSAFLSDIIWISLFFVLVIKFLSIFHFFFICSIVLWLYLKRKEKALLISLVVLVSMLPFSFSIYNNALKLYNSDLQYVYRAVKFEDPSSIERLKKKIDSGLAGTDDYVSYGLIHKRKGEFLLAERMYKRAMEINASNVAAYNNLGNVYLITGKYDEALAQFSTALNIEPQSPIIRYNISRLFLRKKELDKSNSELTDAKRFNEELVSEALRRSSSNINRFVIDMEPSYDVSFAQIFKGDVSSGKRMYLPFEHYITGGILASDVVFWLILMGITIVGIGFLSRYVNISQLCHRCGRPACKYCSPELYSDEECSQCFHVFTRRDVSDPKVRFMKDKEISDYQFFHNIITKLLSIVIPGSIFVMRGMPFKGLFILLLSVAGFVSVFFFNRPNPLPFFSTTDFEVFFKSPFLIAGVVAYAINIRTCFKKD